MYITHMITIDKEMDNIALSRVTMCFDLNTATFYGITSNNHWLCIKIERQAGDPLQSRGKTSRICRLRTPELRRPAGFIAKQIGGF